VALLLLQQAHPFSLLLKQPSCLLQVLLLLLLLLALAPAQLLLPELHWQYCRQLALQQQQLLHLQVLLRLRLLLLAPLQLVQPLLQVWLMLLCCC
jgi:hypothetical protein